MSDIKFSCPQCGQHITCDELAMGQSVACPGCQQTIVVPQMAAAPAPPTPPTQPRITINRTAHQPAAPGAPVPPRPMPVYRSFAPEPEKGGGVKKVISIVLIVAAVGVGGYFGFTFVYHLQQKTNAEMAEAGKNSGGGEMGETASIYKTLDATDPDKLRTPSYSDINAIKLARRAAANRGPSAAAADDNEDAATASTPGTSPGNDLPVVAPTWMLDVNSATVPEGRVNGAIGGAPFVANLIRFDNAPSFQVLRLTQGTLEAPDREIRIYFHVKLSDLVAGKSFVFTSDSRGTANPNVVAVWKTDPKYAAQTHTYLSGYALKVEIDQVAKGSLTGKIYLALPDTQKTVVAGIFTAQTNF